MRLHRLGTVGAGVFLDRTRMFRGTTLGLSAGAALSCAAWLAALRYPHPSPSSQRAWVMAAAGAFGFCVSGVLPVGFDWAAELVCPSASF